MYKDNDFENVQRELALYSSSILSQIGFFPVVSSMPILKTLLLLSLGAIFLRIILNLVVILLAGISSFLIYSLLMISVETRTFELGIFRMIGVTKYGLAFSVIIQAFTFVLPAFILALIFSFPLLTIISYLVDLALGFAIVPVPSTMSVLWAIGIGVVVPLAASLVPIIYILKQTLNDCLDTAHSKTVGVHVTIEYAQRGSNYGLIAFCAVAIVFGLSIYYFLPLSLLAMNFQLMMWIMLGILLSIITGMIILSLNIQHLLERIMVLVFIFFENIAAKTVVIKNLIAHKFRNRRTGIIYSLSLGFLLFAVVSYTIELRNTQLTMLKTHGAYIEVTPSGGTLYWPDMVSLEHTLMTTLKNDIAAYTWQLLPIASFAGVSVSDYWLSDYGKMAKSRVRIFAVPPNYFDATNELFLKVFDSNATSGLSLSEQFYTPRGSQAMGSSSFFESKYGLNANNFNSKALLIFERSSTEIAYEMRAQFLLSSCPRLKMSRTTKASHDVAIGIPTILKLTSLSSVSFLPYSAIMIKVKNDDPNSYNRIYTVLNQMSLQRGRSYTIWSYSNESSNIDNVKFFLDIMFIVIIVLFMFLSFFSLSSSMTANILEQTKELSVLRASGFTLKKSLLIYIYEAFIVVLTSSLIGSIIGIVIGFTLLLQRELFTDLPISFYFPYKHLLVMFGASIICAILSTMSPALYLLRKPIAELIKF